MQGKTGGSILSHDSIPWLAVHNPEIDWEKGEVKMTRCPPWYGKDNRSKKARERQEKVTRRKARTMEGEKTISWVSRTD